MKSKYFNSIIHFQNSSSLFLKGFFLFCIPIYFSSCVKEFVPKIEGQENRIVLNSFLTNTDSLTVSVTSGIEIDDPVEFTDIKNATVSIYEDDLFIENLEYINGNPLGIFKSNFIPKQESIYKIEVDVPEFNKATATASLPNGANIRDLEVKFAGGNSYDVSFNFDDSDDLNFYYLKMYFKGFITDPNTGQKTYAAEMRIEIPQGSLPEAQRYVDNGYIFKDELFENKQVNFSGISRFSIIPPFSDEVALTPDTTQFFVRLETLSEDAYKFYSSNANALNSNLDFFSEPSPTYGNIDQGFGIFAGIYVSEMGVPVQR